MAKPIVLKGGRLFDPGMNLDQEGDILIEDGVIRGVEKPGAFDRVEQVDVEDVSGKLVVPGLIDIHVHLREPGFEWKETILTGVQAAAAGGFTAVTAMPNTKPVNDTATVTRYILDQAKSAGLSRVLPIGAISVGSESKELSPMIELREAGCVAFSDDGRPVKDAQLMRRALEYSSMLGAVLACHEEDESLSCGFAMHEGAVSLRLGLKGMPAAAENVMISRDIELVHLTGSPAHFCHVSSARGALLIRRAKEDGLPVTAEVTPHHLTFTEEDVGEYNTNMKMNPPLRTEEDRIALLQALEDGVIDCLASDHAPHEFDSKNCEFAIASNGILGLQTNLPVTLSHVAAGRLSLKRAIEGWTSSPARCLGITPNRLKAGAIADLTVIDLKQQIKFTAESLCSKSKNTPWLGAEYTGCAVKTFVGGRKVYEFSR